LNLAPRTTSRGFSDVADEASMKKLLLGMMPIAFLAVTWAIGSWANPPARSENGKYFDAEGDPTYHIAEDGMVDWYTYSGFRRYHAECHVCHGPDGLGGSFAPSLVDSMKALPYGDFLAIVANGREAVGTATQSKMPAFGHNKNVMCFIDALYVYLKARSDGALGRGRPAKAEQKSDQTRTEEETCFRG
jgi:methanol metabolism-related c-type cytochrome